MSNIYKKYFCTQCICPFNSPKQLESHFNSSKHKNILNKMSNKKNKHQCLTCMFASRLKSDLNRHLKSNRHKKNICFLNNCKNGNITFKTLNNHHHLVKI